MYYEGDNPLGSDDHFLNFKLTGGIYMTTPSLSIDTAVVGDTKNTQTLWQIL